MAMGFPKADAPDYFNRLNHCTRRMARLDWDYPSSGDWWNCRAAVAVMNQGRKALFSILHCQGTKRWRPLPACLQALEQADANLGHP
jgi:hypothetical protein